MKRFFAWASLLLLVSWRSTGQPTPSPTPSPTYVVTCDGTATMIQQGLYGIADAALQSMVPIASNGPNLILNGDFSYDSAGDDQNAPGTRWSLIQSSFTNPSPARLIQSWVAYGGGSNTYAGWGATYSNFMLPVQAPNNLSAVYFGNDGGGWSYTGNITFDSNGFGQSNNLSFNSFRLNYGNNNNPVTITQTVTGLTVGTRYRLQFLQGAEDVGQSLWNNTGVAAIEIQGFDRVYMLVYATKTTVRTIDFVARFANTNISFRSWGHVNILGPPGVRNELTAKPATELTLDDVILTACTNLTGLPTAMPSAKPSQAPSRPTTVPTPAPTAPTGVPTSAPTRPTASPTALPGTCYNMKQISVGVNQVVNVENFNNFNPPPNSGNCGPNMWYLTNVYTFTPQVTAAYNFSTCNQAPFDTVLALSTACNTTSSTFFACNDDGPGCARYTSVLGDTVLTGGTTYYLYVGGWGGYDFGALNITVNIASTKLARNIPDDVNHHYCPQTSPKPIANVTLSPTAQPTPSGPHCVSSASASFYSNNCADADGCVYIKDTTLRPTNADCLGTCNAGYSGSTCYGCVYDPNSQYCILLLGKPYAPPCIP